MINDFTFDSNIIDFYIDSFVNLTQLLFNYNNERKIMKRIL